MIGAREPGHGASCAASLLAHVPQDYFSDSGGAIDDLQASGAQEIENASTQQQGQRLAYLSHVERETRSSDRDLGRETSVLPDQQLQLRCRLRFHKEMAISPEILGALHFGDCSSSSAKKPKKKPQGNGIDPCREYGGSCHEV